STTACGNGRPLTTLRKYSGICSTVSGVPCASSKTACLATGTLQAELAHHPHHGLHVLYRRLRHNPVAQIKNVARTPVGCAQNLLHALLQHIAWRKERNRVQV